MTEQTTYIKTGPGNILNLDADDQGNFIAFTDDNTVITHDHRLIIDIDVRHPVIRRLNSNTFLLADARTGSRVNAHMYDFGGQRLKSFLAGDAIADIIIQHNKIVITYFDEGILVGNGPCEEGLAVFDLEGSLEFGVNSSADDMVITDCYCICKHGASRVLFYAYMDLKVFALDLNTFQIEPFQTPDDFSGASAISTYQDKIVLHSGYDHKRSFFLWDRRQNRVLKFGEYPPGLRGLTNGKFLIHGNTGYTIVDPMESYSG
ncbi:hypothetical protein [Niabella sp.]|uniref:hypothetical protein n=1 Tax=Niabella sp. TaxID=1962976 RepID=UPI00260EE894|nr:hypothetical protein [Niabella sp.]